jgi:hypothetical protein
MSFQKLNILVLFLMPLFVFGSNVISLNGSDWHLQQAQFVYTMPEQLSSVSFDDAGWLNATVPGTVLEPYITAGIYPDPYFADNMNAIPDTFFSGNDFWYRKSIGNINQQIGKRYFINFKGVNWKSDIYFNGKYLGKISGAFQRADFEITDLIVKNRQNVLAVLVHHIENWMPDKGKVTRKYLGAPTTNGDVSGLDSPAFLAASGWNWLPIVRGRNIGIWNDVSLTECGNVSIHDAWFSSKLALPDTTMAALTIKATLKNHANVDVNGLLKVSFAGKTISFPESFKAGQSKEIELNPKQFRELTLRNPKLWWPNGYGAQHLYDAKLSFVVNNVESDEQHFKFGIREITPKVKNNILFLYCNGVRIMVRGGNWGLPEAMLQCDDAGYDLRVRMHKEANFNMIRNWVGQTGHEAFYEACDKYGILIWDDFWLANPVDGPTPRDTAMFMSNVRDKIKWVRKYPSVALYCGRNEGLPPVDLDSAMSRATRKMDGTRLYIPQSADGVVTGLGPYDVRPVKWYFENRGVTFHSELGIIAFPEVETMRRMLPEKNWWPINNMWAIHDYQWGRSEKFTNSITARFGAPTSMDDYSRRAQLLNYESAKAMFECLQSNQGSGVLLWMSQAAWPSMICQLYDHYFEYTASYFAVKKACRPIHVFYDPRYNEIRLANNTAQKLKSAAVKAIVYNLKGKKIAEQKAIVSVNATSAKSCFVLNKPTINEVQFLKLEAVIDNESVIDNFYWLSDTDEQCLMLNDLPKSVLDIKLNVKVENDEIQVSVILQNNTTNISLLNKLKIKTANGESVLPVFFSDNYVSLVPGETKNITLNFENKAAYQNAVLSIESWNNETIRLKLKN